MNIILEPITEFLLVFFFISRKKNTKTKCMRNRLKAVYQNAVLEKIRSLHQTYEDCIFVTIVVRE